MQTKLCILRYERAMGGVSLIELCIVTAAVLVV